MKRLLSLALLCLAILLLVPGAAALTIVAGQQGTTEITNATDDDVFASGNTLVVSAPVGSLIAAAGDVRVNAPVAGDVIAAGGTVTVNGPVGGKVVLAGGRVTLNGTVQRNAVATGGEVLFGPGARVNRDAAVSGGTFTNEGVVNGTLEVQSGTFVNRGSAGTIRNTSGVNRTDTRPDRMGELAGGIAFIALLISLLVTIGYLVLGLLLLAFVPNAAYAVEGRVTGRPLPAFVIGLVGLIVAVVGGIILFFTGVGTPLAVFAWLFVIAGIMVAGLVVSLALGRLVAGKTLLGDNRYALFIIGFLILNVLYLIPILGGLVKLVVVCLGFGAILLTVMDAFSGRREAL